MIYFKYIKMVINIILEYRMSFWLITIAQFITAFLSLIGLAFLFDRFGDVQGWSFAEVALCFGVVYTAFSITTCVSRGFDMFSQFIISGHFDTILLRPRGTVLQVMGAGFEITRLGGLAQGLLVLGFAVATVDVVWSADKIATLVFMIISGFFIFTGIYILGAVVSFFTVQGLEFINIFTNGGQELASYPLTIYPKSVVRAFTFVIPFGCMNYLPLMYITGRTENSSLLYMLSPLMGILFIVPCLLLWRIGVRYYTSTGS